MLILILPDKKHICSLTLHTSLPSLATLRPTCFYKTTHPCSLLISCSFSALFMISSFPIDSQILVFPQRSDTQVFPFYSISPDNSVMVKRMDPGCREAGFEFHSSITIGKSLLTSLSLFLTYKIEVIKQNLLHRTVIIL
jgi:hypothetical protein